MKSRSPFTVRALLMVFALCVTPLRAQVLSMDTTYIGGNNLDGAMFDLAATGGLDLRIQSFDINTPSSVAWQVYVVTANTSWFGLDNTPSAWTLLATTPVINGAGVGQHTPLNLSLNHPLPGNGQKVGFYVTAISTGTLIYTNAIVVNHLFATDGAISIYTGMGKVAQFTGGFAPRVFNGTIYYTVDQNILSLTQSGPGIGDATLSLTSPSLTGGEGYLLISTDVSAPVGTGWALGIAPDSGTFSVFGIPYAPGNIFHFNRQDVGVFPQVPFHAPPGSVTGLAGATFDVVSFLLNLSGSYDSKSNVVRHTFQ